MVADDGFGVGIDGGLVEGVDLGHGGCAAVDTDGAGDPLQGGEGPSGEVHGGPLAGERRRHRRTDVAATSVDHRVLPIEEHQSFTSRRCVRHVMTTETM